MTIASVLRERITRWRDELDGYGYVLTDAGRPASRLGELTVSAVRPTTYGEPAVRLDIRELWLPGRDADGLGLEARGCHLHVASWHAQLLDRGAEGAERLDVDRRKPPDLFVHRHPFGEPNQRRVPAAPLAAPERWIEEIELLILMLVEGPADESTEQTE